MGFVFYSFAKGIAKGHKKSSKGERSFPFDFW
jgi:hypothetical protein